MQNKKIYKACATIMALLLGTAIPNDSMAQVINDKDMCMVCDQNNNPIPGVIVELKDHGSRSVVATTDSAGLFPIKYDGTVTLTFKHIGYLYKELKITPSQYKNQIKIHLQERFIDNSTPVALPSGEEQNEAYCIGSVATVKSKDLEKYLSTDILTSLQGRIAGFNVSQYRGSWLPRTNANSQGALIGSIPSSFGQGVYGDNTQFTYSSRSTTPVVIVDGIERELLSIDPEDIESVTLKRDALSSMFLGMKSSRGALIITTKTPKEGALHVSFTGKIGTHSSIKKLHPLSSAQYAYLLNEALQNDGYEPMYTSEDYQAYLNHTDPYGHPDVNWSDELLKDHAISQSYNINVTGGGRVAQYFVGLGYTNEAGLFRTDNANNYNTNLNYNRYMISSKVNIHVTSDFTASLTVLGRIIEGNQPGGSGSGYSDILSTIFSTPNNAYPVYNPDGSWGGNYSFQNNLLSQVTSSGYISDHTRDIMATVRLNYDFRKVVPGLKVKFLGGVVAQNRNIISRTKRNPVYAYSIGDDGKENYTMYGSSSAQTNDFKSVSTYQNLYGQLDVDYTRSFGLHNLAFHLMGDTRRELDDYDLPMIPSNIQESVEYDYARKYFAQFSLVESYYNRYAPGRRWGTFFAGGLGYDMRKEDFMKDVEWLDKLKIRAVFGKTGNGITNSGYYTYRQTFSESAGSYAQGEAQSSNRSTYETNPLANPYITWEKANKFNIGVDAEMFHRRLAATFDFYTDKYYDLLQQRGKSIELLGADYPNENIGKTRHTGFEATVSWQDHIGDFNYYLSANWSIDKSKVLFMDEQNVPYDYMRKTGRSAGAIYGLVADGFLSAEDIANNYPVTNGYTAQPGDIKYKDLNNDGVIDSYDNTLIGGDKPVQYFGLDLGLEWKGLEFSMLFQGAYNREIYIGNSVLTQGFQKVGLVYGQAYTNILNRWTPETAETATYPRLSAGGNGYNNMYSSMWLRSGNFIRLKNISLAYNLPETISNRYLYGVRMKFFVNAQNLLTFSDCDLVDPEVTFTSYPIQRCIFMGINLKF